MGRRSIPKNYNILLSSCQEKNNIFLDFLARPKINIFLKKYLKSVDIKIIYAIIIM